MMNKTALSCLAVLVVLSLAATSSVAVSNSDEITSLPGLNFTLNFKQYSGYLSIPGSSKKLHYWFVESQNNPAEDPVVLWMNGGPGCSSLDGFLSEHGPLHVNPDLTLFKNEYSWNRIVNMVYLEAPAGVGFSYSTNQSEYATNDFITAHDNNLFVRAFFNKYPQFLKNDFYISGESYAGFYVPMLADAVDKGNTNGEKPFVNLKGYLVGNGVTDDVFDGNSYPDFMFYHGLFSESSYQQLKTVCRGEYVVNVSSACQDALNAAYSQIGNVNVYDVITPCFGSSDKRVAFPEFVSENFNFHKRMMRGANVVLKRLHKKNLRDEVPCIDSTIVTKWLNQPETKKQLHVNSEIDWTICSNVLQYDTVVSSVIDVHKRLISKNYRVLIYSGDADSAVNYLGTQRWVNSLGYEVLAERRAWYYDEPSYGQQVGGQIKLWNGITFVTIRAAGHMVPQLIIGRPAAAYHFFQAFINKVEP